MVLLSAPWRHSIWRRVENCARLGCYTVTGLISCPETSVRYYRCSLCNGPEERGSHLLCGRCLKSHVNKSSRCKLFPKRIFHFRLSFLSFTQTYLFESGLDHAVCCQNIRTKLYMFCIFNAVCVCHIIFCMCGYVTQFVLHYIRLSTMCFGAVASLCGAVITVVHICYLPEYKITWHGTWHPLHL